MKYFLVFIAMISAFIGGAFLQREILYPTPTCDAAEAGIKAMQACLARQPQCVVSGGVETFKIYHEAQDYYKENCQ